jgi:hypothetical protein
MFRGLTRVAGLIAATIVLVASAAGTATASPGVSEDVIPSPGGMIAHGTHGFVLVVNIFWATGERSARVQVAADRAGDLIRYTAPANLADGGIHAGLGPFGRIDLRWVPDGRLGEVNFSCHGHGRQSHLLFDRGAYVGTLRFRGGNGFTAVRVHRVEWRRAWYHDLTTCRRQGSGPVPATARILRAAVGDRDPKASLLAYQPKPGAPVAFEAFDREAVGPVEIQRSTWTDGGPKTLTSSKDFAAATIEPPTPFVGTATFTRTEHAHGTWRGDLTVEFADGSVAPMAGGPFAATFDSGGTKRKGALR